MFTAPGVCVCLCSLLCVCVYLDGSNTENTFHCWQKCDQWEDEYWYLIVYCVSVIHFFEA